MRRGNPKRGKKREVALMSIPLLRLIFAALCGVGFCAIGGAAVWEWNRFANGQSALSPRHFRWRLLSAAVWLVVLGTFAYATLALWPQNAAQTALARRFLLVSSGALVLMVFAFVLMAVDIFWTVQVGRRNQLRRSQISQATLERELQRIQNAKGKRGGTNGSAS